MLFTKYGIRALKLGNFLQRSPFDIGNQKEKVNKFEHLIEERHTTMGKQRLNEFINTMRYKPVLTIGQFLDDFTAGLEEDGKRHEDKPVFIRTLSDVLRGDGSKSLL